MRAKISGKIEISCLECGNKFIITRRYFDVKKIRRCSRACSYRARKGRKKSEDHKRKIGLANLGKKKPPISNETRKRMSLSHKGKGTFYYLSPERKKEVTEKIASAQRGKIYPERRGEGSSNWKGGITPLVKQIRNCAKYKDWRKKVYERDNFTCRECGVNGNLNADHIIPFSTLFHQAKIMSLEQAEKCESLWNIDNGRTLCVECHSKTDTYLNKKRWHKNNNFLLSFRPKK